MSPGAPALRLLAAWVLLGGAAVAGCSPSIGKVNTRPEQHYGKEITLSGRVSDILLRTDAGNAVVFHLVCDQGHRLVVVVAEGVRRRVGDTATIRGEFLQQHTHAGRTYYDVLVAENVGDRSRWRDLPLIP